jgi:SAM-dependent methyltransferase
VTDSPADFFDAVYSRAKGDEAAVPWQQAMSRRFMSSWLEHFEPSGDERAIVVAAGLGDDAAALAARGVDVTAFDFSPAALEWARTRHATVDVDWHQADLFNMPSDWAGAFDLVVEVFTVQSIQPDRQPEAAAAIRSLLAPGGRLVVVTLTHDGSGQPAGPPWPLHPATVEQLRSGLNTGEHVVEELDGGMACHLFDLTVPAT